MKYQQQQETERRVQTALLQRVDRYYISVTEQQVELYGLCVCVAPRVMTEVEMHQYAEIHAVSLRSTIDQFSVNAYRQIEAFHRQCA